MEVDGKGYFYREVAINSCRKFSERTMVFDLVRFAEKYSVVMNSSDSFPFALETLVTSSLKLSGLLLGLVPLSHQLNIFLII